MTIRKLKTIVAVSLFSSSILFGSAPVDLDSLLSYAVEIGCSELVSEILKHPKKISLSNQSLITLAQENGHSDIAKMLQKDFPKSKGTIKR